MCTDFLSLWWAAATLGCSARASHCGGFSCCGAWALGFRICSTQAQLLWPLGSVALRHVESFQTRDWTCVPCIDRWIPIHWTTREVPRLFLLKSDSLFSRIGISQRRWKLNMRREGGWEVVDRRERGSLIKALRNLSANGSQTSPWRTGL